MTPSLSGTHALDNQKPLELNQRTRTILAPGKGQKRYMAEKDNYPQEEYGPLYLADEILVKCKKKWRRKTKKKLANYCDPEETRRLSGSCARGRLNGTLAEMGKMNYRF